MLIASAIPTFTPAINADNARELQKKGVEARKRNRELQRLAAIGSTVTEVKPVKDPFIDDLAHAQVEYLAKLRACEDPKEAAALSQALKNIRETYHMATGLAKPGVLKPVNQRPRQQSRELPDAPDTQ